MIAIETRGLTRSFGSVRAVEDLDLEIEAGTVTGFLGPNGAGKTTTLRLLLGLLWADRGEIRLFGEPVEPGRAGALTGVGALIEQPSIYPRLTGRENLEVTRLVLGVEPRRVERCLELVDLTQAADRTAGEYSLGMKQRLGLALAMLPQPRCWYLMNPPTVSTPKESTTSVD